MNSIIPIGQEWTDIKGLSTVLVDSKFLPKAIDTPQKAAAIILMARELGVGPMEGFSKINVIQGKPTMSPEMMKARVHAKLPKAIFRQIESTDKVARFEAARPGDPPHEYKFTIEEARALGLDKRDNWIKQPATMLVWRCIAKVARQVFPDCLSGVSYTPEELGASVNEDGEVIEIIPTPKQDKKLDPKPDPNIYYSATEQERRDLAALADHFGGISGNQKALAELSQWMIAAKVPVAKMSEAVCQYFNKE